METANLIGILGGGQLARMLAESAHRLGLEPRVLAASPQDPAAQLAPASIYGSADDPVVLRRFLSQVPVIVFENEFVDCERLKEASAGLPVRFAPGLEAIHQLQDKIRQKRTLAKLGIASSPYQVLENGEDPSAWSRRMLQEFENACVFKWARLGYDGKGTWISEATPDHAGAARFCVEAIKKGVPVYAEKKVIFRRELAVVASRSISGEFAAWPLVISEQENGVCRKVTGPATSLGVKADLEAQAHRAARVLAEDLGLIGTFALEFFETHGGVLWVNEIAPRVHNTGHYTQDASRTSQFENHLRAALGLPLGETSTTPVFAMLNLLGPSGTPEGMPVPPARAHLHWYGKRESRPGRKMGHLNATGSAPGEAQSLIQELEKCERQWSRESR